MTPTTRPAEDKIPQRVSRGNRLRDCWRLAMLVVPFWLACTNGGTAAYADDDFTGVTGRVRYLAFPTFGRDESLSSLEVVPYRIADNSMIFGDARFNMDNNTRFTGNGGLGYREWIPDWERLLGASLWYDFDESTGNPFQATGISLESYGKVWDFRSNIYVPVGNTNQDLVNGVSNLRFYQNTIVFDHLRTIAQALTGFDMEVGGAVPSQFADDHDLRVFAGFYQFFGRDSADIPGFKSRFEGSITENITAQLLLTDDRTFGTNVSLGVSIGLGGPSTGSKDPDGKLAQMSRYVNRNYNVIVTKHQDNLYGIPVINPEDNAPYVVEHVATSAGSGGSGTAASPYATIAEAQAVDSDIIFVHSGSVIDSPVVLQAGQRMLGEGVSHLLSTERFGNILLPTATGGTAVPILQGITGDAVTLATGSEFSGFRIDGVTGNAIVGNDIDGATVRNVAIRNTSGDGVFLVDATQTVRFENLNLAGIDGAAFHVDGGSATVLVDGVLRNSSGRSVVIENTDGTVDLEDVDVVDNGGTGLLIANNDGDVTFGDVNVTNSQSTGIDIRGGEGTVGFTGETIVKNSAAAGINVKDFDGTATFHDAYVKNLNGSQGVRVQDSTGTTSFENLNASTRGGTGVFALDGGTVEVLGGTIDAKNATAVDFEDSKMNVSLTSLTSSDASRGLRIVDTSGSFVVLGDGTSRSGGLITGADVGVFLRRSGTVVLQSVRLDENRVAIQANGAGYLAVVNSEITDSDDEGIDLLNVKQFELGNSFIARNDGISLRSQFDTAGSYSYSIYGNTIEDIKTSPIVFSSTTGVGDSLLALSFNSNSVTFSADGTKAVDVDWKGALNASFTSNAVTGSGDASRGFAITADSATQLAQIAIGQNVFAFDGNAPTILQLTTNGQSELSLQANNFIINAADGIGAEFNIGTSSNIAISDNLITDYTYRGTGLLFSSINGTSNVAINNNTIQLLGSDAYLDRGIIFSSVSGTVRLSGSQDNTILGATTPFSATGTSGQIYVNGVSVP